MERELEQLEGTVEDIIYQNEDNGYTVFEVSGGGVVTAESGPTRQWLPLWGSWRAERD